MASAYSAWLHRSPYIANSVTAAALWLVGDIIAQKAAKAASSNEVAKKVDENERLSSAQTAPSSQQPKVPHNFPNRALDVLSRAGIRAPALAMNFTSSADTERFSTLREAWGLIVNSGIDWSRVGVMVGFGFFFAGPAYTFWYKLLDHKATALLARTTSSSRARTAAWWAAWGAWAVSCGKTVADLTVFDPIYLPLFFMSTNLVSGCSFDEAGKRLRKDFAGTYVVDVAIWAPVQLFNFRFIPLLYQPLLVNGVNVFWNAYLSTVQHHHGSGEEEKLLQVKI